MQQLRRALHNSSWPRYEVLHAAASKTSCTISGNSLTVKPKFLQEELMKASTEKDEALKAALDSLEEMKAEVAAREVRYQQLASVA